jgi:hypothetical protein
MKRTTFTSALLLLLTLAVGASGPVFAQGAPAQPTPAVTAPTAPATADAAALAAKAALEQLCGAPLAQANGGQPPNYGGYPYDYPEDAGGENDKPAEAPKPQNPVQKVCEDGKIQILLGNSRHFGNRIGDHIPLTVLIKADPSVQIDFTSLSQKVLGFDGSDFELAAPAVVRSQVQKDGSVVYRLELTLQTWVPKENLVFNLDLRYATGFAADGKTPNWKRLTTPDFVVTRSNTADNGEELLEGDLDGKSTVLPWLTYPLLTLGIFLVLLWPGLVFVKFINRIRPRVALPPKVLAWRVFDRVFGEAKTNGFTREHYQLIAMAVRRYLGATKGVPIEPATFQEVRHRLENDPELPLIESALTKCERVMYKNDVLTERENAQLIAEIEKLVPRHWDSK